MIIRSSANYERRPDLPSHILRLQHRHHDDSVIQQLYTVTLRLPNAYPPSSAPQNAFAEAPTPLGSDKPLLEDRRTHFRSSSLAHLSVTFGVTLSATDILATQEFGPSVMAMGANRTPKSEGRRR
jgi:hypothetical protein